MSDQLNAHLERALNASEQFWNALIAKCNTPADRDELVVEASKIRSQMLASMSCARSMFETNMQCLGLILNLQKQKQQMEASHQTEIEVIF